MVLRQGRGDIEMMEIWDLFTFWSSSVPERVLGQCPVSRYK